MFAKSIDDHPFKQITFLVDGCLFRVPRFYFESESGFFKTTFQLPQQRLRRSDGDSDEQPFRVDGVDKADFKALLSIMYPKNFQTLPTSLTKGEWISVLRLSTMWNFDKIRKLSIEKIEPEVLDPIQKFDLAQKYEIDCWKLPAVMELVERGNAITLEEGLVIGIEATLKIVSLREYRLENEQRPPAPAPASPSSVMEDKIKQTFGL